MTPSPAGPPPSDDRSPAGPEADVLRRIARGGAVSLAGNLVAGASTFVLTLVVTRAWPPEVAGTFFAAMSLFLIASATALLGVDTGLARFVLRLEGQGRGKDVGPLLRLALRPVVVTSLLAAVVVMAVAGPLARVAGLPEEGAALLRVLAVALPLATMSDALLSVSRSYGAMRPTVVLDKLVRSGGQPVVVAVAAVAGGGVLALGAAWALPYAVAAAFAWFSVRAGRGRRAAAASAATEPATPDRDLRREFWSYTWLRGISRLFQVALQRLDIVLVAALRSPAEAALYTAATRFVVLGQLGVQAIQQVLQPQLTRLLTAGDDAATSRVFQTSTAWTMALSWPVYLVAGAAAPLYLSLFGAEYVDVGQGVVVIMALAMLLATAAGSVDVMLLMAGRSLTSLGNNTLALVVNVGLGLVMIPLWGIEGAAAAWAIALAVRNLLPFWQVHRDLDLIGFGRSAALVALVSTVCFIVPLVVVRLVTGGVPVLAGLAAMAVGSLAYALALWRLRAPLDLDLLLAAARRRRRPSSSPDEVPSPDAEQDGSPT